MLREIAAKLSVYPLKLQRDIIGLTTLSSPPSQFFEKFNSADIDRERSALLDPVSSKLSEQPELCADF
jgi:hypothetical protein